MNERLVTPSEAARILGCSADAVRDLSNKGTLPIVAKVGPRGMRLFWRHEVEALAVERAKRVPKTGAERTRAWRERKSALSIAEAFAEPADGKGAIVPEASDRG